jgi:hypothetical protein
MAIWRSGLAGIVLIVCGLQASQVAADEYCLHNLSDADFTYSGPAVDIDNVILQALAPEFGIATSDPAYLLKFRNPVLSFVTAERLLILYADKGMDEVRNEVQKLRGAGVI